MRPSHSKVPHAAALGQRGGQKRIEQLNAAERSALARHAARSRWHPREAQAEREKAREISQQINQLIQQAFKNNGQLPLV